jgi:hypothetical protein
MRRRRSQPLGKDKQGGDIYFDDIWLKKEEVNPTIDTIIRCSRRNTRAYSTATPTGVGVKAADDARGRVDKWRGGAPHGLAQNSPAIDRA